MKKGFFQDKNADFSMMRLLVFIVILVASLCFLGEIIYCFAVGKLGNHLGQIIAFATVGFGAKFAQKQTENKID